MEGCKEGRLSSKVGGGEEEEEEVKDAKERNEHESKEGKYKGRDGTNATERPRWWRDGTTPMVATMAMAKDDGVQR
jgi:hypothetical protein